MIKFDRLWDTLKDKGISQSKLITEYHISKGQLDRLRHNKVVCTSTLDKLLNILECDITDILEHIPDSNKF